jgi:plastocyanin
LDCAEPVLAPPARGPLAPGASVSIGIVVTPTFPKTITNHATVGADGPDPDPSDNSSDLATVVQAQAHTQYVTVTATKFTPKATKAAQGDWVQWSSFDSSYLCAVDASGMSLFSSCLPPNGYSQFRFVAAGTYPYADSASTATGSVAVPVIVKPAKGALTKSFTITWAVTAPPAGFV